MEKFILFTSAPPEGEVAKRLIPSFGEYDPIHFFDRTGNATQIANEALIGIAWEPPEGSHSYEDLSILEARLYALVEPDDNWLVLLHNGSSGHLHVQQENLFEGRVLFKKRNYRHDPYEPYSLFCEALELLGTDKCSEAIDRLQNWFGERESVANEILFDQFVRSMGGLAVCVEDDEKWARLGEESGLPDLKSAVAERLATEGQHGISDLCRILEEEVRTKQ